MSNFKAGFVAIIGRPNTGKSTLVNALVGTKIVITSHHPNTTRNPIRGIISKPDFQMIVVDTPGIHKPKTLLGSRLNSMVSENLESVDAVLICLPADEEIGFGDEYIAKQVLNQRRVLIAVTKTDSVKQETLLAKLIEVGEFAARVGLSVAEIVPISAKNEDQTDLLLSLLAEKLPISPSLYPEDITTDQASEMTITELIREAAIENLYEEVPHSIVVTIDEMTKREGKDLILIVVNLDPSYAQGTTVHWNMQALGIDGHDFEVKDLLDGASMTWNPHTFVSLNPARPVGKVAHIVQVKL